MSRSLARLLKSHDGVTQIERAMIIALISVAAVAAFELIGTNLGTIFYAGATPL